MICLIAWCHTMKDLVGSFAFWICTTVSKSVYSTQGLEWKDVVSVLLVNTSMFMMNRFPYVYLSL